MSAMDDRSFGRLRDFLARVPAITAPVSHGGDDNGWWVKFSIDMANPLAWHVVQELAYVLNHLSLSERLPTVFKPVSPPPYLNGGPAEYLYWVIEAATNDFRPGTCADWLEGRMPQPVDDLTKWPQDG